MENPPFPNDFPLRDSQRGPPTIATRTLAQRPIVVGTVDASIKEPLGTGCTRWALPRSGTDHLLRSWCPVKGRDTKNRIPFAFFSIKHVNGNSRFHGGLSCFESSNYSWGILHQAMFVWYPPLSGQPGLKPFGNWGMPWVDEECSILSSGKIWENQTTRMP